MNIQELEGRSLALLLISESADGDKEMSVVHGVLVRQGDVLFLDRGESGRLEIRGEWRRRIRRSTFEQAEILDSEYFLPLYVGDLPGDASSDDYEPTGIKLPRK